MEQEIPLLAWVAPEHRQISYISFTAKKQAYIFSRYRYLTTSFLQDRPTSVFRRKRHFYQQNRKNQLFKTKNVDLRDL